MGGIIDLNATCPWELYLFAFIHLGAGIFMYLFDACLLTATSSCTDTERVIEKMGILCLLYVGVMFTVLTYHNKNEPGKITTLSNFAAYGATALLVSVVFFGNASLGGIERSWMHMGDVLTMIILLAVLTLRVSKADAEWAEKKPLGNMGVNCKTLLLLILVIIALKFIAFTDFIDPLTFLADGAEMTDYAMCMWKFIAVLMIEIFLAILFSVLFDDDASHELVVLTVMVMSLVAAVMFYPAKKYFSSGMGLNGNAVWIRLSILVIVCILAIVGGRRGSPDRSGYQNVGS